MANFPFFFIASTRLSLLSRVWPRYLYFRTFAFWSSTLFFFYCASTARTLSLRYKTLYSLVSTNSSWKFKTFLLILILLLAVALPMPAAYEMLCLRLYVMWAVFLFTRTFSVSCSSERINIVEILFSWLNRRRVVHTKPRSKRAKIT